MTPPRLTRSRTERRIAGVCGGFARYLETDPVFIRLGFIAAGLIPPFAPAAILGYLACWILVPEEDAEAPAPAGAGTASSSDVPLQGASAGTPAARNAARPAFPADASVVGGAIFIGLGIFFLMLNLGLLPWELLRFWRWRVLWPVLVIGLGLFMLLRALRPPGRRPDAL